MIYSSAQIIFHISAIVTAVLLVISFKKSSQKIGRIFFLIVLTAFVWVASFLIELSVSSYDIKILTTKIQTLAASVIPVLWLYMVLLHTENNKLLKFVKYLYVIPAITNFIIWFIPRPNWFWGSPVLVEGPGTLTLMNYDYRLWFYYIQMPHTYVLLLLSIFFLAFYYMKTHLLFRLQTASMIFAILLPAAVGALYIFDTSPIKYINYTSATFSVSCLILFYAFFRYRLFEVIPQARHIAVENLDDSVIVLDEKRRIVDMNPSAFMLTGMDVSYIGCQSSVVDTELFNKIKMMLDDGIRHDEIKVNNIDNEGYKVYDIRLSMITNKLDKPEGSIFMISDCTEKARLFSKIYEQSIRDELTGIYNRRFIFEQGYKEICRTKRITGEHISVMVMDVDKMKTINDRYGHSIGDELLTRFANQCMKITRVSDIFGRIGGDEFALVLPGTGMDEALDIAKRMIDNTKMIKLLGNNDEIVSLDISVGLVCSDMIEPEDFFIENMIKIADDFMYKAKKQGGRKAMYSTAKYKNRITE